MNTFKSILATLCLSSATFAQAIDAPGGDDGDLSGGGAASVISWEPMIVEFYAAAEHGTAAVVRPKTDTNVLDNNQKREDLLGELNQWRAIKPKIAPRPPGPAGSQAYKDDEPVVSAWQRMVTKDGRIEFVTYGSNGTPMPAQPGDNAPPASAPPIHTIWTLDHRILFSCDLDILTNAPATKKDKMVNDYFKMKQLKVTAVKVSDDLARYRDAIPADAPQISLYGLNEASQIRADYRDAGHALARPTGMLTVDVLQTGIGMKGVWEFRVKAIVLGKVEIADEYQEKEVEGAIRIAFVGDQKLSVDKIRYDSARKSGEKDDGFIYTLDGRKIPVPRGRPETP